LAEASKQVLDSIDRFEKLVDRFGKIVDQFSEILSKAADLERMGLRVDSAILSQLRKLRNNVDINFEEAKG